jgi:transcriptional regulator with XRE-family HTH domain
MSPIIELGSAIQVRRIDMGLTQTGLAKLGGLSRATVNQLENGTAKDLSLARASRLLSVLGLSVSVSAPRAKSGQKVTGKNSALELAARTSSVSYTLSMNPVQLREALVSGKVPSKFEAHLGTLLDEAPIALLAAVVEQLHTELNIERARLWKTLRTLAKDLKSDREIWR